MAIRDSLARWLGVQSKASIIGLESGQLPDRALEKGIDDGAVLSTYGDDPWPYICASKIAQQGTQAPLRFGTLNADKEFQPVPETHPIQQLFDAPNELMDGGELLQLLLIYSEMVGHAPLEIVSPTAGKRRIGARLGRQGFELWPVNPTNWRIVANPDATIKGYLWIKTSESDIRWTPDQMAYYRLPNPNDRWYGQGRIAAVRQSVMAEEYAAVRDKKFEQRLGVPPGILSSEMPLGEPQAQELQKRWEQAVGGYRNAGKIAVLGSKTTYQNVALSARDAQWVEQRRWRVQEISAAFEVPLVLVLMSEATFANAEEARAEFWEGKLAPTLDRLARWITVRIVPRLTTEPLVARFDYSGVSALNENADEVAKRAVDYANTGTRTVNELRKLTGEKPLLGEIGDLFVVPGTLALKSEADIIAPPEPPVVPPPGQAPDQPPPDAPPAKARRKSIEADRRDGILAPIRDGYARDLGSFFMAQRSALRGLEKAAPEDEQVIARAQAILGAKRWTDRLSRISLAPIETSLTLGATDAAELLGIEASFNVATSEEALAKLTAYVDRLGVTIQSTTNAEVRTVLTNALEAGLDNAGIQDRLDTLFGGYQDWRLDRISRTEVTSAYNLGAVNQYKAAGFNLVDVVDGDKDEPCAVANGSRWTTEQAENDPISHPNCTRTFIAVTDSDRPFTLAAPVTSRAKDLADEEMLAGLKAAIRSLAEPPVVHVPESAPIVIPAPVVNVDLASVTAGLSELKALLSQEAEPIHRTVKRDVDGRIVEVIERQGKRTTRQAVIRDPAGNIMEVQ